MSRRIVLTNEQIYQILLGLDMLALAEKDLAPRPTPTRELYMMFRDVVNSPDSLDVTHSFVNIHDH